MSKYRIVRKEMLNGIDKYYVEERKKFLWFRWWGRHWAYIGSDPFDRRREFYNELAARNYIKDRETPIKTTYIYV